MQPVSYGSYTFFATRDYRKSCYKPLKLEVGIASLPNGDPNTRMRPVTTSYLINSRPSE